MLVDVSIGLVLGGLVIFTIFQYLAPNSSSAAWFDDSWSYRSRIDTTITSSAADISNLQTLITVTTSSTLITAGKMQSSCQDLRFTNTNGKLLPYYIDSGCNTGTMKVWVMLDLVPKSTTTYTMYMYYGNASAAAATDAAKFDNVANLTGYWTFNETSVGTAADSSITANNGTATNSPTIDATHTNYGNALSLTAASSQYVVTGSAGPTGTAARTIEAWIKSSSTGAYSLFSYGVNSTGQQISFADENNVLGIRASNATIFYTATGLNNGSWHHVAMVIPSAATVGDVRFYMDGVQLTSVSSSSSTATAINTSATNPINIGRLYSGFDYFNGIIDDVKVYSTARTNAQIAADYANTSCGGVTCTIASSLPATITPTTSFATEEKASSPVAYWKFDEGNGVVANNSQWKSSGTMTNLITNPSFETDTTSWSTTISNAPTSWAASTEQAAFGSSSGKMVFNGSSGTAGKSYTLAVTNGVVYTVSAYIKITSVTSGNFQFDLTNPGGSETDMATLSAVTNGWVRYTGTFTAASTSNVSIRFFSDTTANLTAYVDGIQAEVSSTATNYCDGSITGNGTHSWSGTAHASTSTCSNGTDGMISGATWQSEDQSISGKSLRFNGTSDYVQVAAPATSPLDITDVVTMSAWVKITTTGGGFHAIISRGRQGSRGYQLAYNGTQFSLRTLGSAVLTGTSTPTVGTWYFVAGVINGSSSALYVNGVQETTGTLTIAGGSTSDPVQIGVDYNSTGTTLQEYFGGQIDEPKIYNFAQTAAQIKANYVAKSGNEGGTVLGSSSNNNGSLSNGLVGYWKMDESSWSGSGAILDASGNSNHGTSQNSATVTLGKYGNGGSFDGALQYATVADSTSLNPTTFTTSYWVNLTSTPTDNDRIFAKSNTGVSPAQGWITWYASGKIYMTVQNTVGGSSDTLSVATSLATSTWRHYTFTFDGTTLKQYENGALVGSTTMTGTYLATSQIMSFASTAGGGATAPIKLDEVRHYNRALSPNEVSTLYNFAPSPVGLWNFEEGSGTTALDRSGNSNNGILTNGPTYTTGKYGKGISFDGTNDGVSIPDNSNLSFTNKSFTIGAWIKTSQNYASNQGVIVSKGDTSNWEYELKVQTTNVAIFQLWPSIGSGADNVVGTTAVNDGIWHYIVGTADGTNARLYVDGKLETTTAITATLIDGTSSFEIGRRNTGTLLFNGSIDDVRVYSYARSAGQIVEDMNGGHPLGGSPVGSPVGYWKLDEGADNMCSGGTNDACNSGSAGSTLDGAQSGMASPATSTSGWTQSGKFGKALVFDDSNDYISLPSSASLAPENGTISLWANFNDLTTTGYLFSENTDEWAIYFNGTQLRGYYDSTGTLTYTPTFSAAQWVYIAFVFNKGGTCAFYINGVQVTSGTCSSTAPTQGTAAIGAISTGGSNFFGGKIDEVKFYNAALTASQILVDMNRGQAQVLGALSDNSSSTFTSASSLQGADHEYCVPGDSTSCAAPVARWDFEEGSSTSAYDKSGNGNTGTLTSGPTWTTGKVGQGVLLDGTNDYVSVADSNSLDVASTMTLETWIKTSYSSSAAFLLGKVEVGAEYSLTMNSGIVRVGYYNTLGNFYLSTVTTTNIADGNWHHIAGTLNSSTPLAQIYVDGKLESTSSSVTGTQTSASSARFTIGQNGNGTSTYYAASFDNVRVFNYVRSAAQVAWDYNKGGPSAWWKFDECQGTTANDSSGNSNTGTISIGATSTYTTPGTCAVSSASTAWYNGASGKRNYSLAFDGTDDYISVPTSLSLKKTTELTIATWVKTSSSGQKPIWSNRAGTGSLYFGITGGRAFAYDATCTPDSFTSNTSINNSQWRHIVYTLSGTSAKFYVDGVLDNSTTRTGCTSTQDAVRIGHDVANSTEYFVGQLDDLRVYQYALTATQIKTLVNEGASRFGPSTGAP